MTDETGIRYHNGRYWNEKESEQPPDRYWDGELKNGIPHGTGTYYVPNGMVQHMLEHIRMGKDTVKELLIGQ